MDHKGQSKYIYEDINDSEHSDSQPWIRWFCSLKGNDFFVSIEELFIRDSFNLSGLESQFKHFQSAIDLILDQLLPDCTNEDPEILDTIEEEAEQLYGLIHARYILTPHGLESMLPKFKNAQLGRCPRILCNGQPTLPVGLTPAINLESVRLYCPRCEEIYASKSSRHAHIDGAFFGPTFPHLFLLTFPDLKPRPSTARYVPRVFGYKLHSTAYSKSLDYKMLQDDIDKRASQGLLQTAAGHAAASPNSFQATQRIFNTMTEQYVNLHTRESAPMNDNSTTAPTNDKRDNTNSNHSKAE